MVKPNPYKILGVSPSATLQEIRYAYKRLSRSYHPDLNPDPGAEEKMILINEAYHTLINPQKRDEYDRLPYFQMRIPPKEKLLELKHTPDKKGGILSKLFKSKKNSTANNSPMSHFKLGVSYGLTQRTAYWDIAKEEFIKVLTIIPNHLETHYNLGVLYYRKGNWENALYHFNKVLTINPQDSAAQWCVKTLTSI